MKLVEFERKHLQLHLPDHQRRLSCIDYKQFCGITYFAISYSVVSDDIYGVWLFGAEFPITVKMRS